jgi:hypothetical protein
MGRAGWKGVLVAALLALVVAAPSSALAAGTGSPPSRLQFVAAADDICEVPYRKGLRLLYRAGVLEGRGDLRSAGRKTMRAGRLFLGVNERVADLERPPADANLIEAWLNRAHEGFVQVVRSGRKLRTGRERSAARLLDRAQRTTRRANKKVAALGFDHCA